jgi:putative FmdB family regulatory protein
MPTYDYVCPACQSAHEIQHGMHDTSARLCPVCGEKLEKRITAVPTIYWPGRALGERDGWFWDAFPKMESIRDGEHTFRGVDLPGEKRTA